MALILCIDDQIAELKYLESLLVKAGHQVSLAKDGYDGIEKMRKQSFDLVITDAIMPGGVSGYDVTRTIRQQFGPDKLPVILLTGRRERRDVERAIESGVNDYMIKPVDPASLIAKVAAALEVRAQHAAFAASEVPVAEVAEIKTSLNVTGISEKGVTLRASQPLRVGTEVDLGLEFYKKLGLNIAPGLTVGTCEAMPGNQFRLEANFSDLNAEAITALRLWCTFNRSRKIG